MANDQTVKITLVAVAQPYVQGMKQASDTTSKLGRDIDSTGDKAGKFGSKVNGAKVALAGLAAAGAAVAGTALVSFLSDAVTAAGDLEQSVGGVDAVFKDSASTIHAFGETSAEAVGLSRDEFNKLITVTGAMLKNKGLEDFTGKSLDLVKVGADLAATFGGTAKEAVEALNAAMRGESDPIERYGISLNETAVNAELAAKGLVGLEGAALDQAKAQARIDIITRQSTDALGAFAREADTLQGQQQRLNAEWQNAKAELGEALLPALTDAVGMMRDGLDVTLAVVAAFEKVPGPVKAAAAALAAVHLLGGPIGRFGGVVTGTMRSAGEAIDYARLAAAKAGGGFSGAAAGLKTFTGQASLGAAAMGGLQGAGKGLLGFLGGPWGAAFTVAAGLLTVWVGEHMEAKREQAELKASLDQTTGAITAQTEALASQQLNDGGWLRKYQEWGGAVDDLTQAYLGNEDAMGRVRAVLADANQAQIAAGNVNTEHGTAAAELGSILDTNVGKMAAHQEATRLEAEASGAAAEAMTTGASAAMDLGAALGGLGDEAIEAVPVLDDLGRTEDEVAKIAQDARDAHNQLRDAILGMTDAAFGAIDADIAYQASLDALTESVKTNGQTTDIATEAGRNNMSALTDVAAAARDAAKANLENGDSLSSVQGEMAEARESFIRGAESMGLSKAEANALADQLGMTSGEVSALSGQIAALPSGKNINITVTTRYVTVGDPANSGYSARTLRSAFAAGGYTGDGARSEEAGIVHKGEFVQPKHQVSKPGMLAFHTDLWRGFGVDEAYNRHKMRGYADGGLVSAADARWSRGPMNYPTPSPTAAVDSGVIASAVASAMSSWQPLVSIGGREFRGVMREQSAMNRRLGG